MASNVNILSLGDAGSGINAFTSPAPGNQSMQVVSPIGGGNMGLSSANSRINANANANVAILVTTVMPKSNTGAFCKIDDIWVISPQLVKPMSEALRHMLLEQYKIKVAEAGKEEKAIELYNFISSPQFDRYIRDVFDTFTAMQKSLAQEKRAMTKIWKARETQINKLTGSMGSIVGHMQGITMSTLPALNSIDTLEEIDMDLIEDQSEE